MAEPLKSVLLVDYDSLHRSLTRARGEAAARLVARIQTWTAALESGRLMGGNGISRSLLIKRCYADPDVALSGRVAFAAEDFRVVDCPADADGIRHADVSMAIDATETLSDPNAYDEFIVLSAEPTLAPLLTRLKVHKRRTVIYADATTPPAYRAFADAVLEIGMFVDFLLTYDVKDAPPAPDRAAIEAFARKIHAATNIPLFSPKTFAELFGHLAAEIRDSGYHFQTTAKNVAEGLVETGRSVTRRQVMFIVKGLALKGHVFSSDDTPRRLAEVFREQAKYLIDSAGLSLDEAQQKLLNAWLVDRVPVFAERPLTVRAKVTTEAAPDPVGDSGEAEPGETEFGDAYAEEVLVEDATEQSSELSETDVAFPTSPGSPAAADERPAAPPRDTTIIPPPAIPPKEPASAKPRFPMVSPDAARAAIAARIAQSSRPKPGTRPPTSSSKPVPEIPPSTPKTEDTEAVESRPEPDEIENSILAAIAEAVDVLVEDTGTTARPKRGVQASSKTPPTPTARSDAKPKPRTKSSLRQDEDIGDEIQRIIATYNRNRNDEPRR